MNEHKAEKFQRTLYNQADGLAVGLKEAAKKLDIPLYDRAALEKFAIDASALCDGIRCLLRKFPQKSSKPVSPFQSQRYLDLGNGMLLELVLVPAGEFMMGSNDSHNDEKPIHEVRITKPFYLGKYEVTQEQYERIMGTNPSEFKGSKNPVEMVSWEDAIEFCKKLSVKAGSLARLPTEAEWEYACRAGTSKSYSYGDSLDGDYMWYSANSGTGFGGETHEVGTKLPNPWNLYDMHGNVWEWCQDWYGAYSDETQTDPTGPAAGSSRVLRGGSWYYNPYYCRAAYRHHSVPAHRYSHCGFRVVVSEIL